MKLSDLTLAFLEQHCNIIMPKLGDTSLRDKLQQSDVDISDIYPPSGEALKHWEFLNLNPGRIGSLSGTYNEIQLKDNIIIPMLTLAGRAIPPFLTDKCSEYPIWYKDDNVFLEGSADLVYGKPPEKLGQLLDCPFFYVHEYKCENNPADILDTLAQLLGGMWVLLRKNKDAGYEYPIFGLMVKGQTWRFAELHTTEKDGEYNAIFDTEGFFIRSDMDIIFRALRHYFLLGRDMLEQMT
ncbi:MAG: hypothetical protein GY749_09535 [Desulfobacteraceae bacterium]|nr:hypothetical protein [Desulfobacteraceae bacterium]